MKLKADENLSEACIQLMLGAGHDVATVPAENLCGASDPELIEICRAEARAIITLDLDFSNPLLFPPSEYPGIVVLRLPRKPIHNDLLACVRTLLLALEREELKGKLWSVERGRVRVYQPPQID